MWVTTPRRLNPFDIRATARTPEVANIIDDTRLNPFDIRATARTQQGHGENHARVLIPLISGQLLGQAIFDLLMTGAGLNPFDIRATARTAVPPRFPLTRQS